MAKPYRPYYNLIALSEPGYYEQSYAINVDLNVGFKSRYKIEFKDLLRDVCNRNMIKETLEDVCITLIQEGGRHRNIEMIRYFPKPLGNMKSFFDVTYPASFHSIVELAEHSDRVKLTLNYAMSAFHEICKAQGWNLNSLDAIRSEIIAFIDK